MTSAVSTGMPTQLKGYEILAPLSAGGMATLYLGRRVGAAGFKKLVAIKIVHPHLAQDASFVQMFLDEALLCSRIQHPNVVHVEELGQEDGAYFLVMEFVHGAPLSQLLKVLARGGTWLSTELAVSIAMSVADGLHAAHEATDDDGSPLGVVHRDVSPQNVLLDTKGYVKLIDFGVAKSRSRMEQTQGGMLKGKLRYMAPEQARAQNVDRRTDVFALGIVLWEMLAMRRLYAGGDEIALLLAAQEARVSPPSLFNPSIPKELDQVVLSALARSPDDRPATADAFRDQLARALPSATGVQARQIGVLVRTMLADALERQTKDLPESVSRVLRIDTPTSEGPGDATRELTVAARGVASYLAEDVILPEEGPSSEGVPVSEAPDDATRQRPKVRAPIVLGGIVVASSLLAGGWWLATNPTPPHPDHALPSPPLLASSHPSIAADRASTTDAAIERDAGTTEVTDVGMPPAERDRRARGDRRPTAPTADVPSSARNPEEEPRPSETGPSDVHGSPLVEDVPF